MTLAWLAEGGGMRVVDYSEPEIFVLGALSPMARVRTFELERHVEPSEARPPGDERRDIQQTQAPSRLLEESFL